jgi:hypothetical protein
VSSPEGGTSAEGGVGRPGPGGTPASDAGTGAEDGAAGGCTENAQCASGFCSHPKGKAGTCSDGELYCYADEQCASGRCNNAPDDNGLCVDGDDEDKCFDASDCTSGKCISTAFGQVCSSGVPGAPCATKNDCEAGECLSHRCKLLAGNGGTCSMPNECEAGLSCVVFNIATFGKCSDKMIGSPCSLTSGCTTGTCVGASSQALGTCS